MQAFICTNLMGYSRVDKGEGKKRGSECKKRNKRGL